MYARVKKEEKGKGKEVKRSEGREGKEKHSDEENKLKRNRWAEGKCSRDKQTKKVCADALLHTCA